MEHNIRFDRVPAAHMREGAKNWVLYGVHPGQFLTAFLCNDLRGAAAHADDTNCHLLWEWCRWFYNEAPAGCWGSQANFESWLAAGGLVGIAHAAALPTTPAENSDGAEAD